ncbi:MAG TPA: DUF5777 family beta-barrel protein [Vicinamibacterales bacterium]|nr:DUF5777 family beta-barrel protein [Vicinamibacterales bacterium]
MQLCRKAIWGARHVLIATCLLALTAAWSTAQDPAPAPPPAPATQTPPASDPDVRVDPLQPDFTLVALPTTLRVPNHKMSFRVSHRFLRSLGAGDAGDLFSNLFGFDNGAQIGLELRYGLRPGTQVGFHRTSDQTIQLFGQQSIVNSRSHRYGLDAIATFEGTHNLHEQHQSALGVILSARAGRIADVYAEPMVVINSNPVLSDLTTQNDTVMIGLGARVRIRPATYLVGEITPRVAGYRPAVNQMSFGLEERVGGHLFQIDVGNGYGTTFGQIARGGVTNDSWFIGFNIARKFF